MSNLCIYLKIVWEFYTLMGDFSMTNLLISLSGILLTNGFPLLSKLLENSKPEIWRYFKIYRTKKTNIKLVTDTDTLPKLSLEDLTKIDMVISSNSLDVEQCLLEKCELESRRYNFDSRDLQNQQLENYTKTLLERTRSC